MQFFELLCQFINLLKKKHTNFKNLVITERIKKILIAILFYFITKKKIFKSKFLLNFEEIENKIINNVCSCDKTNINNSLSELHKNINIYSCCNWSWRATIAKGKALLLINSKHSLTYIYKVF